MSIISQIKGMGVKRHHIFILIGIIVAIMFFKPVTQAQALDLGSDANAQVVIDTGKSIGLYIWDIIVAFVKTNSLIFTLLAILLVVGFVFFPKKG